MWKKLGIGAVAIVVLLVLVVTVPMAIWPSINDVKTGETPEYPDVQPRQYEADIETVGDATVETVDELGLWEVEDAGDAPERIEAIRETRLFDFIDDVTVRIDEVDDVAEVNVRSRSRTGEFDYGQNARNIGELFDALDDQIGDRRIDE